MPNLALLALVALFVHQDPSTRPVRGDETNVIPRSKVIQGGGGRLVIPGGRTGTESRPAGDSSQQASPGAAARGAHDEFRRRLSDMRRSLHLPGATESAMVEAVGTEFTDAPAQALAALRTVDVDDAYAALLVLARFGTVQHAGDLQYLLLTRSFGSSTDVAIDVLAALAQDAACERLISCLTSSRAPVRFHAERALGSRLRPSDEARLLGLSRSSSGDVRIKTVRLLGNLPPSAEVRTRLLEALAEDALVADAGVDALITQGPRDIADLQAILRRPAVGRSFGYAALAMCALQDLAPRLALFDVGMKAPMLDELEMPDPFQRSAVACALADLAMRSEDLTGNEFADLKVVGALIDVAAPNQFIPHLSRLKSIVLPRLVRFTGQDFGSSTILWRKWFEQLAAGPYVGARARVVVSPDNAALAVLTWNSSEGTTVLRGERATVPVDSAAYDYLLTDAEIGALVAELTESGFMGADRGEVRLRENRWLSLQVGGARVRTDPATPSVLLDRFDSRIAAAARPQNWQLWRDPVREPDAAAFWRAELRWREHHVDPAERAARERGRLVQAMVHLRGPRRQLAYAQLAAEADLRTKIGDREGADLLAGAGAVEPWDDISFRLVELALVAPGDRVWRDAVDTARIHDERPDTNEKVLPRVFALLGPERLIACLDGESTTVRRAAMAEVGRLKDLDAAPSLLHTVMTTDTEIGLRIAAVQALGAIKAPDARQPLLELASSPGIDAQLKRATWVALGDIGGEGVFDLLRHAMATPDEADRIAIVRALGALRQPEAAFALTEIVAVRKDDTLGSIALQMLRQQGDRLATPALRMHVNAADPVLRGIVALALADFQDPEALPELFTMLDGDSERLRVVAAIANITGHDVVRENQRSVAMRNWWNLNRNRAQGEWFLSALAEEGIATSLEPNQLYQESGSSAVAELTRLVMELQLPHLRALAGRLLRTTTGVDFGTVLPLMTEPQLVAICDRYRLFAESTGATSRK